MSLYVKFIWFTVMTMLISGIVSFVAMNTYYHQHLKERNNNKNMVIAKDIAADLNGTKEVEAYKILQLLGDTGYQFYMTDGKDIIRFGGAYRNEAMDASVIEQVLNGEPYNGMRDFPRALFVTGFFANELKNSVGVPVEIDNRHYALFVRPNIKLLFQELHLLFGGLAVGIIILSIIGMLIVAKLLIRPITKLTIATEKMRTEEAFDVPLAIHRKDEIGRLADQFLSMREQIKRSMQKQKEFVHNVSHDIQSPLHTMKSYLATLEKDELTVEERKHYFAVLQDEAARISLLTTQLLTLASFDSEVIELVDEVQVDKQIQDVLSRLRYALDDKELGLVTVLEPAQMQGNAVLLQTVWENLLTNAVKYSHPGGFIEVRLVHHTDHLLVTIQDEGVGMSVKDIEHAFDRFYRADEARSRHLQGSGLGLAIVKEIIELHKGSIKITSQLGEGTTVQVKLPILKA